MANEGWGFYVFSRLTLRGRRWFFRLKSGGNHKIVCQSEGYQNFADCMSTVRQMKANAARASIDVEPRS